MLYCLLPDKTQWKEDKLWLKIARTGFVAITVVQLIFFNIQNVQAIREQIQREQTSESVKFYHQAIEVLEPTRNQKMNVYYDYRVYIPFDSYPWYLNTAFEMLDYSYIKDNNFDILLLINQRVKDYLNPNAEGINEDKLVTARVFYTDVRDNQIKSYILLYEDNFGKAFIREDLYEIYYKTP